MIVVSTEGCSETMPFTLTISSNEAGNYDSDEPIGKITEMAVAEGAVMTYYRKNLTEEQGAVVQKYVSSTLTK